MSFLFRFLKVWLLSLLRPRLFNMLEPSVIRMLVWPNDLDLNVHVNNGRYLTLMDLGRMDLMFRSGAIRLWLRHGWQPLVGASMCRHFKPLEVFQSFTLTSRVVGWDDKWIYFEQRFERKGRLYCLGLVKGLMAGAEGVIPTAKLGEVLRLEGASPELPPYVKDWLKSERAVIDMLKAEAPHAAA